MHLFCNQVRIDHSRSSKVESAYGTLVRHSYQGLIISDMLQVFGWNLQIFPILLSCGAHLRMFYSELCGEVYHEETRVMVVFSSKDRMIVVWVILIQHQRVTDRQSGRQTDGRIYYSSYGVFLTRCKSITYVTTLVQSNSLCDFQYGGRRHLGFCRIWALSAKVIQGPYSRCLCQIWWKSIQKWRSYCCSTDFKMAAAAILDLCTMWIMTVNLSAGPHFQRLFQIRCKCVQ